MDTISIAVGEKAQAEITNAIQALDSASALVVTNQQQYDMAGAFISGLKKRKSALEKERKEITSPIDEAKKVIMAKFAPHIENIEKAIATINSKMITHYRAEEQKRIALEAAAAEKARKEQEKLEKRAATAEAKGQFEKAAALQEASTMVVAAPVEIGTSKQTATTTIVTTWSAEVYDKLSLIKAVAAGQVSMSLLEPDQSALNKMAQANKELLNVPGVRAVATENIRAK